MKSLARHRLTAALALGCALVSARPARGFLAQDESAAAVLLSRARTLEQRGRLDLAKQDWAQVLLIEPNDAEALAGLVRAAKAEGRNADAATYLARLRASHPKDPQLAGLEEGSTGRDTPGELKEAARLSQSGDKRGAMLLYRRVYGLNPPPGEAALAYYETEAGTEDGRPHAIAGLRAMADRFPSETRYQVALGRLLLASPRTRAEGRTLLERLPENAEALAALHGIAPAPGGGGTQTAAAGALKLPPQIAIATSRAPEPSSPRMQATAEAPQTGNRGATMHRASAAVASASNHQAFAADEQAAFAALNGHRQAEAEQRFHEILSKDPTDPRALAGMGYLRVAQGDLKTAVVYFEQAQENGDRSLALTRALVNTQFDLALQQAAGARTGGDLATADSDYRAALRERPNDASAIEGLGGVLLQEERPEEAISLFTHLTKVRPMDPGAWRGLIVAEVRAGKGAAALTTSAGIPSDAKSPLMNDSAYLEALAAARQTNGTQVARVEVPPPPPPAPPPAPTVRSIPKAPAVSSAPPVVPPTRPSTAVVAVPKRSEAGSAPKRGGRALPSQPAERAPVPTPAVVASVGPVPPAAQPNEVIATERVQQADALLLNGDNRAAAALFRDALAKQPGRTDALKGLVTALSRGGRDAEAAAVLHEVSASVKEALELDATFDGAAGAVYLRTEKPTEALGAFARAQDVFSSQRLRPPLDLVLQIARLLAARQDDPNLYKELIYLGERSDLSDAQRREVQMIWTEWAVRRARALANAGNTRRAVVVLNAAAEAFAGNGEVLRSVATGYAGVGRAKEAVVLLKAQDLSQAPAQDLEGAVGAAIAAHDFRAAEMWLRYGLARFASDPEMLTVAAELEQARGHEKRAVELSEQAKALAPPQNPGQVLAAELREARAGVVGYRGTAGQLTVLLMPAEAAALANGGQSGRPFLPVSAEATGKPSAGSANEVPVLSAYEEPSR